MLTTAASARAAMSENDGSAASRLTGAGEVVCGGGAVSSAGVGVASDRPHGSQSAARVAIAPPARTEIPTIRVNDRAFKFIVALTSYRQHPNGDSCTPFETSVLPRIFEPAPS
jgi:hypothetical protein